MAEIVLFQELYSWHNDHDQSIFVDGKNGLLIYQNVYDKSIRVIDFNAENASFNSTRFKKPLCESITFSPDGRYLLYWYNNPLCIGLIDPTSKAANDVIVDCSCYDETIVLSVFWTEPSNSTSADFVVVCTTCIDIYHFSYANESLNRLCSKRVSCYEAWNDISGTYLILLRKNHTLQPYHIHNKEAKVVNDIELSVEKDKKIQKSDICISSIYGDAYCIYKDTENGNISLRSLSNSRALDVVLEVKGQGWMDILIVDNLLVVLTASGETNIFDIYMRDSPHIAKVPQNKLPLASISSDVQAYIPNVLIDYYGGFAYRLVIDHNLFMLFLSRSSTEPLILDFYQRRRGSLQRVIDIVLSAVGNRMSMENLFILFSTAVIPYYWTLMHLNKFGRQTRNATIPFHLVEEFLGDRSVITEYRMGMSVLYSLVIRDWNLKAGENLYDAALALLCHHMSFDHSVLMDARQNMDIQNSAATNCILKSRLISKSDDNMSFDFLDYLASEDPEIPDIYDEEERGVPDVISVTICYFKALLLHHLYPSHLLQIFLFDACLLYNNLSQLVFLIKTKVIKDSPYICYRLMYLYIMLKDQLLRQMCNDMAIRLKLYDVCVTIGITDREYYQTLVFLKAYNVSSFPLHRILFKAANDVEKQTSTPHLWPLLLAFTRSWMEESSANPQACNPPNLRDCEMWLPIL